MLLRSFKEKAVNSLIEKAGRERAEKSAGDGGKIRSLALVIDYEKQADLRPLLKLAEVLGVENDRVYILGYVQKKHKKVNYLIPVFAENSVSTRGKIKDADLEDFLNRSYDLAVHYHTLTDTSVRLVSALIKASLKAGIHEEAASTNDLTILTDEGDHQGFREELIKYLRILNKV